MAEIKNYICRDCKRMFPRERGFKYYVRVYAKSYLEDPKGEVGWTPPRKRIQIQFSKSKAGSEMVQPFVLKYS